VVALPSKMDATSQVGKEAMIIIAKNLNLDILGVDVGLRQHQVRSNARERFLYKTDDEIDCTSLEDLQSYARLCHNGWKDSIAREKEIIGSVCITIKSNVSCAFGDNC
jgi:hypothetical protein